MMFESRIAEYLSAACCFIVRIFNLHTAKTPDCCLCDGSQQLITWTSIVDPVTVLPLKINARLHTNAHLDTRLSCTTSPTRRIATPD